MTFGQRLSKAREEAGLTQDELAKKLYITRQGLSRWENDRTQPSIETLALICKTLGKQPNYFIETEEQHPPRNYKQLTFSERTVALNRWKRERCRFVFFIFWLIEMIMLLGVGITSFFAIRLAFPDGQNLPVIWGILGGVMMFICGLILMIVTSRKYAILYNEYLLSELNVIRTGKLFIGG